jgi:outer membrane beta-barrel protein
MRRTKSVFAILTCCLAVALPLRAQDAPPVAPTETGLETETPAPTTGKSATDEGIDLTLNDRIKALARKTFLKAERFELTPQIGFTVNDPFIRTWTGNLRLAYHLNDAFAIEIGGGYTPTFGWQRLDPTDQLRRQVSLINADAQFAGLLDIGMTFSPMYGKFALFGDNIVYFDAFVSGGVGATIDLGDSLAHPAVDIGFGARIFVTKWLVLRGDLRDYLYSQDRKGISTLQNLMFVNLGVGIYFPFDFTYKYEAARVNRNG